MHKTEAPLTKEKAIQYYTEFMRLVSVGAYSERQIDGSYGEDGVEESIDSLNAWGYQQGLMFVGHEGGSYTLEPMPPSEVGSMYQGLSLSIETLQGEVSALHGLVRAFTNLVQGDSRIDKDNLIASAQLALANSSVS